MDSGRRGNQVKCSLLSLPMHLRRKTKRLEYHFPGAPAVRIIPVIDLKQGQVVHAIAGKRSSYQPVQSVLCDSSRPADIAGAFANLGLTDCYVADLDAIEGHEANVDSYRAIGQHLRIWLDAGVRTVWQAKSLLADSNIDRVILGLESMSQKETIQQILTDTDSAKVIVSIDMKDGQLLTDIAEWKAGSPIHVGQELVRWGARALILLDLARVGLAQGPGTEELCRALAELSESPEIICGGGIATVADIQAAMENGADGLLIATAIHTGKIRVNGGVPR